MPQVRGFTHVQNWCYCFGMTRTSLDGKSIKMVLQWLLNKEDLKDQEIAEAIDAAPSTFSRRKDQDDYPTYEELARIGEYFGLSPRVLQISFGHRDLEDLVMLSASEMRQYLELGGGNHPHYPALEVVHHPLPPATPEKPPKNRRFEVREDAPPI